MIDVIPNYAFAQKCVVEHQSFNRLPLKQGMTIRKDAIKCGTKQWFTIAYKDEFGNSTSLVDKSIHVEMINKSNQNEIKDLHLSSEDEFRKKVDFILRQADVYQVNIKLGEDNIHPEHCTFDIPVIHHQADFTWTKVLNKEECFESCDLKTGEELERTIFIQARDQFGNYCKFIDWEKEIKCQISYYDPKTRKVEEVKYSSSIDNTDESICCYTFIVNKFGVYKSSIEANGVSIFGSPYICNFSRDITEIEEELRLQQEIEENDRRKQEEIRKQEELIRAEQEKLRKDQEEKERLRLLELELKRKLEEQQRLQEEKEKEAKDLERRKRIAERLARIRELEREKEAQKKLAMQRLQEKLERKKKMKRIGGGFTVPFEISAEEINEIKMQKKVQNFMEEDDEEIKFEE